MSGRHWSEETRWQPIAEVVERLKARVDAAIAARDDAVAALKARVEEAIAARDDFAGEAAHEALIRAEMRLMRMEEGCAPMDDLFAADPPRPIALDGSRPALRPCRWCGSRSGHVQPPMPPHGEGVRCAGCGRHLGWLPKAPPEATGDGFDVIED